LEQLYRQIKYLLREAYMKYITDYKWQPIKTFSNGLSDFIRFRFALKAVGTGVKSHDVAREQRKNGQRNGAPGVAIRDYRCPEMLINLVLTFGLLLVIKQPWILLKSPTLESGDATFYLSFLAELPLTTPASERFQD